MLFGYYVNIGKVKKKERITVWKEENVTVLLCGHVARRKYGDG
jgi:hypothetical protein